MILFREHRGSLDEALLTLFPFETREQLVAHVRSLLTPLKNPDLPGFVVTADTRSALPQRTR